jgi:hypothetical protein
MPRRSLRGNEKQMKKALQIQASGGRLRHHCDCEDATVAGAEREHALMPRPAS